MFARDLSMNSACFLRRSASTSSRCSASQASSEAPVLLPGGVQDSQYRLGRPRPP